MDRATAPGIVTFCVPLPPLEASSNFHPASRAGRMAQSAVVKAYRTECARIIRKAKREEGFPPGPIALQYFWFLGKRRLNDGRTLRDRLHRPKDRSNAETASKAIQDAMTDAGLLPKGDAACRVRTLGHDLFGKEKEHGGSMQILVVAMTDPEANDGR